MDTLRFDFDAEKFVQASVYLTERCPDMTKMKLFKLLFFSDKKHLSEYGRPIAGGHYVAMKDGPVHSEGYDIVKNGRHDLHQYIQIRGRHLTPIASADTDSLSDSDLEILDHIVEQLGHLSAEDLSDLSHKELAWRSRRRNADMHFVDFMKGCDSRLIEVVEDDQRVRDLADDISLSEEPVSA